MYKIATTWDELTLGHTYHFNSDGLYSSVGSNIWDNYFVVLDELKNFEGPFNKEQIGSFYGFNVYSSNFIIWIDKSTQSSIAVNRHFKFDFTIKGVSIPSSSPLELNQVFNEAISYDVGLLTSYTNMFTDYLGVGVGVLVGLVSLLCLIKMAFRRG